MSLSADRASLALDVHGLQRLKRTAREDSAAAVDEAARQFEALFVQKMLEGMRATIPESGLYDERNGRFYTALLDQQQAQGIAGRGIGLARMLSAQLQAQLQAQRPSGAPPAADAGPGAVAGAALAAEPRRLDARLQAPLPAPVPASIPAAGPASGAVPGAGAAADTSDRARWRGGERLVPAIDPAPAPPPRYPTQPQAALAPWAQGGDPMPSAAAAVDSFAALPEHAREFVSRIAAPARAAARASGVPAELIIAQAALETGWGQRRIPAADGRDSHNLFGIKAGGEWKGAVTEVRTHEYIDGKRQAQTARFRVYPSYDQAFADYARLIARSPRYAAVRSAPDAHAAAHALQQGGYATDPAYADKLGAILDRIGPGLAARRAPLAALRPGTLPDG